MAYCKNKESKNREAGKRNPDCQKNNCCDRLGQFGLKNSNELILTVLWFCAAIKIEWQVSLNYSVHAQVLNTPIKSANLLARSWTVVLELVNS